MPQIHENIADRKDFQHILNANEGVIIIKMGAEWCKPCTLISPYIKEHISTLPDNFTVYDLDIDDNFEIYAYLKSMKMVTGIPTLLAYYKGNTTFASDECVCGVNKSIYDIFFKKCIEEAEKYN